MKKKLCCIAIVLQLFTCVVSVGAFSIEVRAESKDDFAPTLYAQSATFMDAESGRILFEKKGDVMRSNASTTKIMTCILVLELDPDLEQWVEVSAYAAKQPKVHMGLQKGEYYRMEDLQYGLMLESYNDAAVVIAEYYGSKAAGFSMDCSLHTEEESRKAVLTFARKMNEKAKEIGCENTFFITPI